MQDEFGHLFPTNQRPARRNERNEPFEALAEVSGTDWNTGRGELNKALALIRAEMGDVSSVALAEEIHVRARRYHALMPTAMLTPTALAKHWKRVKGTARREPTLNEPCETCNDDRLVVAEVREDGTEAYTRCPACNAA